jgi:hypothetical protein
MDKYGSPLPGNKWAGEKYYDAELDLIVQDVDEDEGVSHD